MLPESNVVPRRRLIDRLDAASSGTVVLVSAPAGYGKASLVAAWLRHIETPSAWYSIDGSDNDPGRSLGYLVTALQTIEPELGAGLLEMLEAPESPEVEGPMALLANEVADRDRELVLVLDDVHVLDNAAIISSLAL